MTAGVSLITPSYHRDFDACRLLCESVDAYVSGFDVHYIVVSGDDLKLFAPLAGPKRRIVDGATLLPPELVALPKFLSWKNRQFWWAPGIGKPVNGWHVQQLRKFAMAPAQPGARVMFLDSDNCFCRPFDAGAMGSGRAPLYRETGGVNATRPDHVVWWSNAHRLLGLDVPALPGDDFIGQMIVWDTQTVRETLARIERATGLSWWKALCRTRQFSEYMIYGVAASSDPEAAARHAAVTESPCLAYWDGPALDAAGFDRFVGGLRSDQSAIAVQSFTGTSIEMIRHFALGAVRRERAA